MFKLFIWFIHKLGTKQQQQQSQRSRQEKGKGMAFQSKKNEWNSKQNEWMNEEIFGIPVFVMHQRNQDQNHNEEQPYPS